MTLISTIIQFIVASSIILCILSISSFSFLHNNLHDFLLNPIVYVITSELIVILSSCIQNLYHKMILGCILEVFYFFFVLVYLIIHFILLFKQNCFIATSIWMFNLFLHQYFVVIKQYYRVWFQILNSTIFIFSFLFITLPF